VNYTIATGTHGVYLLSCTQTWKPSGTARGLAAVHGVLAGVGGHQPTEERQAQINASRGAWSECPAFSIDTQYVLTVNNTSDAQLVEVRPVNSHDIKPKNTTKLEYLGSASLPEPGQALQQTQAASGCRGPRD
jgi:hypothetical protein